MKKQREHILLIGCARLASDLASILIAFAIAVAVTRQAGQSFAQALRDFFPHLVFFTGVWIVAAMDQRLFVSRRSEALVSLLFSITKTFFVAWMFTAFLLALFIREGIPRGFFVAFGVAILLMLLVMRLGMRVSLWRLRRQGYNSRGILLIGANERTAHLVEVFQANEHYGYHVVGFLEDDGNRRPILEGLGVPWLGNIQSLEDLLVERIVDGVYISLPVRSMYETVQSVAHLCEGVGVPVRFVADLFPLRLATSDVTRLDDIPLLSLSREPGIHTQFALRRFFDILTASALLLLLVPMFAVVALMVRLDTPGPVFVVQRRGNRLGDEAEVYEFRTCHADDVGAPTRVGMFLKRYGLNELPHLVSVIQGEISLTGWVYPRMAGRKGDSPA